MDMERQWRQGITLTAFASGLALLAYFYGTDRTASFGGLAVGVAGMSIAIQQFYIYSLIGNVVDIARRAFYLSSSTMLIVTGVGIALLCAGRILVYDIDPARHSLAVPTVLILIGSACVALSPTLLWSLLFNFFAEEMNNAQGDIPEGGDGAPQISRVREGLASLTLWRHFSSTSAAHLQSPLLCHLQRLTVIINLLACCYLLIWVLPPWPSGAVGPQYGLLIPGGHDRLEILGVLDVANAFGSWLDTVVLWTWVGANLVLLLLLSLVLVVHVAQLDYQRGATPGQSLLLGFAGLYLTPILLHSTITIVRDHWTGVSALTVMLILAIPCVFYCLYYVAVSPKPWWPADSWRGKFADACVRGFCRMVFAQSDTILQAIRGRQKNTAKTPTAGGENTAFWITVVLLVVIAILMVSFADHPWMQDTSVGFYSFAALTLGCAGLVAIDLRNAADAFDRVRNTYLEADVHNALAHETINNIRAMDTLLASAALKTLTTPNPAAPDDFAKAQRRVENLMEGAQTGISAIRNMVIQFRDRQQLASDITDDGDVYAFIQDSVAAIRKGLPTLDNEEEKTYEIYITPAAPVYARFNRRGLYHALRILLDNAVAATVAGRKNMITISVNTLGDNVDRVEILIADTGSGMPHETAERFGAPQPSRTGGYGVGLSIAKNFIARMGGEMLLHRTRVGEGTALGIRLRQAARPLDKPKFSISKRGGGDGRT